MMFGLSLFAEDYTDDPPPERVGWQRRADLNIADAENRRVPHRCGPKCEPYLGPVRMGRRDEPTTGGAS